MSLTPLRAALALLLGLAGTVAISVTSPSAQAIAASDVPVGLTITVPLVTPAGSTGLITADALAQFTSPAGLLSRQLDAVIDRPVAIGIDPMILVSIRILGSSAPPTASAWLERLRAATNETFPLTYADSDLTLMLQAGSTAVLQPQSFDFAIDPTLFSAAVTPAPGDTPAPTPTSTTDTDTAAGPPPLPTTEELLEWPYTMTGIAWPSDGTVVASDLSIIEASGYDTTILNSGNVERAGQSAPATADGHSILVSDDAISTLIRKAAQSPTVEGWNGAIARLSDALAGRSSAAGEQEQRILATLVRGFAPTGYRLVDTLEALELMRSVRLVPLSSTMAASASAVTVIDQEHSIETSARVAIMLAAESAETLFASIVESPESVTAERRLHLLALTAHVWEDNPTGWQKAIDAFLAESSVLRNSVHVVESSTINLFADRASLPITVSNTLSRRITVYITVRPETALLKVENSRVELTVEPNSQGKGQVPVQSISNGTVQLVVSLSSGTGVPINGTTAVQINVQAGWETPVTVGIAAIVIVVFGVGIVRSIVRRRKPAGE